jgi:hypothetical protein
VLRRDYRVAFLHFLPRREEAALHRGYELGRSAVAGGLSILDVARVHHDVLLEELRQTPPAEVAEVATAASEFLAEVLATSDMTQRGYLAGQRLDGAIPPARAPDRGAGSGPPAEGGSVAADQAAAP